MVVIMISKIRNTVQAHKYTYQYDSDNLTITYISMKIK